MINEMERQLRYIEQFLPFEDLRLQKICKEVTCKFPHYEKMLSGHIQGTFLTFISNLLKPQLVLEIGSFLGYSAHCLLKGILEGGKLICIEHNIEYKNSLEDLFKQELATGKIRFCFNDALDELKSLARNNNLFDLIFIDADKRNYINYYNLCMPLIRKGGIIIADNVLWRGKVAEYDYNDGVTQAIREFNDYVNEDSKVSNFILPIRDGLMIIEKL